MMPHPRHALEADDIARPPAALMQTSTEGAVMARKIAHDPRQRLLPFETLPASSPPRRTRSPRRPKPAPLDPSWPTHQVDLEEFLAIPPKEVKS